MDSGFGYIDGYDDGFAYTAPVGSFAASPLGLYDLSGNVYEWCEDKYDPSDTKSDASRVLRGGSWFDGGELVLRSSDRYDIAPSYRRDSYGFRCVVAGSGR